MPTPTTPRKELPTKVTKTAVDYFRQNQPVYTENELQEAISLARLQEREALREQAEKLKMNVDEQTINYYEDEEVAPRTLERNKIYNRAIDDVLALLSTELEE